MSNLIEHARVELDRIGMFDEDSDYRGALGKSIMELITCFAAQGHTGFSAPIVVELFSRLAMFEPLSALTYLADEWEDCSEISGYPLWQNRRDSRVFSNDEGKTHWNV